MSHEHEQNGEDIERQLVRYLDGELSDREARALEDRLQGDPRLRELLQQYAALDAGLAALRERPVEGLDEELQRADIVAALERKVLLNGPSHRRRLSRPWAAALAAAAVVAVAAAVTLLLLSRQTGPQPPGRPVVRAGMLPAGPQGGAGIVQARPLPLKQMQLRLSPEDGRAVAGVPAGTVYASSGPRRRAEAEGGYPYPIEWNAADTY
jgi:predicted protein tyrosine phosphatase